MRLSAVAGCLLAVVLAVLTDAGTAQAATVSPGTGPVPGMVAHPIGRVHLEEFEWFNLLQVVDASNHLVRTIKVAGNPTISKPDVCTTVGRIRVNDDYTYQWKLNYFTRLCAGRGLGTHAIPVSARTGVPDMNVADLGKPPLRGAPLSHGCLRMTTADAEYVYSSFSRGVPIYFVKTPWRPIAPEAPAAVRTSAGAGSLTVAWLPAVPRGAAVTSYLVTVVPGGPSYTVAATATSLVIPGLAPGVPVQVSVAARSSVGWSAAAVSPSTTPYGLPGAPVGLRIVRAGVGRLFVEWDGALTNGAAITSYQLSIDAEPVRVLPGSATFLLLTDLPSTTSMHVGLLAVNVVGSGPSATADLAAHDALRWPAGEPSRS